MSNNIHLKSLSGDIITISLANIYNEDFNNLWDAWRRISFIIGSEKECSDSQVVIIGDEDDENDCFNPPVLIRDKQYNFFIRDKNYFIDNFTIRVSYFQDISYKKYSILIMKESSPCCNFDVYQVGENFYHQKKVEIVDSDIKINTDEDDELLSMYYVLYENLNIEWYDKAEIIDRIMMQYDTIERYREYNMIYLPRYTLHPLQEN